MTNCQAAVSAPGAAAAEMSARRATEAVDERQGNGKNRQEEEHEHGDEDGSGDEEQSHSSSSSPSFQDLAAAALAAAANERPTGGRQSNGAREERRSNGAAGDAAPGGGDVIQVVSASGTVSNRTPRACSWCRRRKRKCDGARPTCCWCAKGNLACNYPSTLLKRGPQSGMMKRLKKKVEELEQQLNTVRVLPQNLLVGPDGHALPSTMSISSFLHRIRSMRNVHDAAVAAASANGATPSQLQLLQSQTVANNVAVRDRLYLTSFLASFNSVFPILDREWEDTYLQVLYDDAGQVEPPLYWTFQYTTAIAIGALVHLDGQYALESALVARHAASALFDEAHSQVLRGLLLLSFALIGLGQSARASCYIAVANRMIYLLSRPPCIDPHVPNADARVTSTLAFPGTFPDARVPLTLPPQPASNSSYVSDELKLMYALIEDMSSAAQTMHGTVHVGWDRVERCVVEAKKAKAIAARRGSTVKVEALPVTEPPQTALAAIMASPDASVQLKPFEEAMGDGAASGSGSKQPSTAQVAATLAAHAYHPLSNDHLLTLGLECRHYSRGIFDSVWPAVSTWSKSLVSAPVPASSQPTDLRLADSAVLHLFVFLTSFRGDFMQLVRPTAGDALPTTMPPSTAISPEVFQLSLANTRTALKIAEALVEGFAAMVNVASAQNSPKSAARALSSLMHDATKKAQATAQAKQPADVKMEDASEAASTSASQGGAGHAPARLARLLLQVSTASTPLHKQTARQQLHALALLFKAVLLHMLLLDQETDPTKNGTLPAPVAPAEPNEPAASSSSTTCSVQAAERLTWSNVILASNTATSFVDGHGLDLSYCPFYALLMHLNIQIKLKYTKQCMAGWKRAQQAQAGGSTAAVNGAAEPAAAAVNTRSPVIQPSTVTLATATQSLLDSLHYLHMDFAFLDSLQSHWDKFAAGCWRDAQERIAELLHYLRLPVGTLTGSTPKRSDGTPTEAAAATAAGATATSDPAEAALQAEGMRVHALIAERYPLFTPGYSQPKPPNPLVSASLLSAPSGSQTSGSAEEVQPAAGTHSGQVAPSPPLPTVPPMTQPSGMFTQPSPPSSAFPPMGAMAMAPQSAALMSAAGAYPQPLSHLMQQPPPMMPFTPQQQQPYMYAQPQQMQHPMQHMQQPPMHPQAYGMPPAQPYSMLAAAGPPASYPYAPLSSPYPAGLSPSSVSGLNPNQLKAVLQGQVGNALVGGKRKKADEAGEEQQAGVDQQAFQQQQHMMQYYGGAYGQPQMMPGYGMGAPPAGYGQPGGFYAGPPPMQQYTPPQSYAALQRPMLGGGVFVQPPSDYSGLAQKKQKL